MSLSAAHTSAPRRQLHLYSPPLAEAALGFPPRSLRCYPEVQLRVFRHEALAPFALESISMKRRKTKPKRESKPQQPTNQVAIPDEPKNAASSVEPQVEPESSATYVELQSEIENFTSSFDVQRESGIPPAPFQISAVSEAPALGDESVASKPPVSTPPAPVGADRRTHPRY